MTLMLIQNGQQLYNAASGMCLSGRNAGIKLAKVQLEMCANASHQRWELEPFSSVAL